jgi:PKD repeat protein
VYSAAGSFDVTLIVTDNGVSDTINQTNFIKTIPNGVLPLQENCVSDKYC